MKPATLLVACEGDMAVDASLPVRLSMICKSLKHLEIQRFKPELVLSWPQVAVKEVSPDEIGDLGALAVLGAAAGPLLDLTGPPGLPAHTSTPKALQSSTPKAPPGSTPTRVQQRPRDRRPVRSVNLFSEVSRLVTVFFPYVGH